MLQKIFRKIIRGAALPETTLALHPWWLYSLNLVSGSAICVIEIVLANISFLIHLDMSSGWEHVFITVFKYVTDGSYCETRYLVKNQADDLTNPIFCQYE